MDRCPKCHRFGIEYACSGFYQCVWKGCGYLTMDYADIENAEHPIRFQKFIDSITKKESLI